MRDKTQHEETSDDSDDQKQKSSLREEEEEVNKKTESSPFLEKVKDSILGTLFTPAPQQEEEEPKLLFDEDTRSAGADVVPISSTEASIQKLETSPVPKDDGPQMIFEKETSKA